jgi:Raf kinase inhibitor-like YbhB/YbcL family protein
VTTLSFVATVVRHSIFVFYGKETKVSPHERSLAMKAIQHLTLALIIVAALPAAAQQRDDAPPGDRPSPPPRNDERGRSETLTDAQVQQVKTILAKYNPATLDAAQARAIHDAFRQAGLRGGPAMNDAVRAAGFDPDKLRDLAPPPGTNGGRDRKGPEGQEGPGGQNADAQRPDARPQGGQQAGGGEDRAEPRGQGQKYTLAQATSDRAQLSTIAFSGLAFLTGDFGPDTFIPPGKVCDFFGFQYMRDIDAAQKGHNPKFLDRVAGNVLKTLTAEQRKLFATLAQEQSPQFTALALKRFPLIQAFCRELKGEIPAGSAGLNREAVKKYVGEIFAFDAELSYQRARMFGRIATSLTAEQKAALAKMKFGDFNTWPEVDMEQYKLPKETDRSLNVAYMTYASEFFSWYAGSVEADVYFCPERHGTYFGSFYMKDMPAMGKRDYDISTSVTGDSGEAFLQALTAGQRAPITGIIAAQRQDLQEVCDVRRAVSAELRKFLKGEAVDHDQVLALGRRYGELDGEMSWMYATAFAKAGKTLTADQRATFRKLRNLEGYTSAPAYLYSSPMKALPAIPSSDFLFQAPVGGASKPSSATPATEPTAAAGSGFVLRSPEVADGGALPKEFTGDGASVTLPLAWSGVPAGTKSFAVIMHHIPGPGDVKWYWTLYNIPADVQSLPKNVAGVGMLGNNSVNGRVGYAPPHSKGPGPKTYIYTVYALSALVTVDVPPAAVTRDVLLAAMKGKVLGTAEMKVVYTRQGAAAGEPADAAR